MKKSLVSFILISLLICCVSCNLLINEEEKTITCNEHEFRTASNGNSTSVSIVKTCTKCGYQYAVKDRPVSKGLAYEKIEGTQTASVSLGTCSDLEIYIAPEVVIEGETLKVVEIVDFMDGSFFEVYIPSTVTKIDDCAFMGCELLTEVDVPDSVTELGGAVFASCHILGSVNLPATMTDLPDGLFMDCLALKKVTPASVIKTENAGAFSGCEYFIAKNNLEEE